MGQVAAVARDTLNDGRGWNLGGSIAFEQVSGGGHFQIVLASPGVIEDAAPVCSAEWNCRVGSQVLVNDVRWRSAVDQPRGCAANVWPLDWERDAVASRHGVINSVLRRRRQRRWLLGRPAPPR